MPITILSLSVILALENCTWCYKTALPCKYTKLVTYNIQKEKKIQNFHMATKEKAICATQIKMVTKCHFYPFTVDYLTETFLCIKCI